MKKRVLVYTDCYIFGGSEHLISILVSNFNINNEFDIYFSYRSHETYNTEVKKYYQNYDNHFPIFTLTTYPYLVKIDNYNIHKYLKNILKLPFKIINKLLILEVFNAIIFFRLIKKISPDIIHVNNGGFPGANSCNTLVYVSSFLKVKALIYQINNTIFKSTKLKRKILNLSNGVTQFIVASSDLESSLIEYFGISPNKIIKINNTIKEEESITLSRNDLKNTINLTDDSFLVCSVGFLLKSKGHIYLLEAIKEIKNSDNHLFSKIKIILIGSGPEYINLNNFILANNLENTVYLFGYKTNIDDYIYLSDLFIFPSIADEDMPLVILTAMKYGKLILATSIAGIKEQIVNNESGILVSPDIKTLSNDLKINILKSLNLEFNELSDNAKKRYVNYFSNNRYVHSIIDVYNKSLPFNKY